MLKIALYLFPTGKLYKKIKKLNNLPSNFETDFKIGLKMLIGLSTLIFYEKSFQKQLVKMLKIICLVPVNARNKYRKIFTLLEIG